MEGVLVELIETGREEMGSPVGENGCAQCII